MLPLTPPITSHLSKTPPVPSEVGPPPAEQPEDEFLLVTGWVPPLPPAIPVSESGNVSLSQSSRVGKSNNTHTVAGLHRHSESMFQPAQVPEPPSIIRSVSQSSRQSSRESAASLTPEQFASRLADSLARAESIGQSLRVRLAPVELGEVLIEVHRTKQGGIVARLEAGTQSAKQALSEHAAQLQARLTRQGKPVERIDIVQFETGVASGDHSQPESDNRIHPVSSSEPLGASAEEPGADREPGGILLRSLYGLQHLDIQI